MGFVVSPPHIALCAIMRLMTSAQTERPFETEPKLAARFVQFCIRQRYDVTSLRLPSLDRLLSLLQEEFGEHGVAIGDYCRDCLSVR